MRKILLVVLAILLMTPAFASAETIDLDSMTWAQLKVLYGKVANELWSREETQEVEVPAGIYKIGTDIPAGKWSIYPHPNLYVSMTYGKELNSSGTSVSWLGSGDYKGFAGKNNWRYTEGEPDNWTITLKAGYYIEFDGTVIFRTPKAPTFKFN